MAKDTKNAVVIDDVKYQIEDLSQESRVFLDHVVDLDRKLAGIRFSADQLQVGRNAFMQLLSDSLKPKEEAAE